MVTEAKPFRVTIRVKNNRMIRLREELELTSGLLAEKAGVTASHYCALENLRARAFNPRRAIWTMTAQKIAEFHGVSCEWLWPEEVREIRAKALMLEANARDLVGLPPSVALEAYEFRKLLGSAAESLTGRERHVLAQRFGTDEPDTLATLGKEFNVSTGRMAQIQERGLQNLRRHKALAELWKIIQ